MFRRQSGSRVSASATVQQGAGCAYKSQSTLEIGGLSFVEEVYVETTHDLDELTVDDLQGFIVCLQRVDKLRLRIHHFFG